MGTSRKPGYAGRVKRTGLQAMQAGESKMGIARAAHQAARPGTFKKFTKWTDQEVKDWKRDYDKMTRKSREKLKRMRGQ